MSNCRPAVGAGFNGAAVRRRRRAEEPDAQISLLG